MIKISDLVIKAKDANSQEVLAPVYNNPDYEVWVGIWLAEAYEVDIFLASSIQLGFSEDCTIDLRRLTKAVDLTKQLHDLGYSIYHCGNDSIYVEFESNMENVNKDLHELLELLAVETANINVITD